MECNARLYSEVMLLSKTNTVGPTPPVIIGGCLVKLVNKSRLLGVTVDDRLTWSPHLSEVKKSFANKLNPLRKIEVSTEERLRTILL